jgi:hypothetical protein
MFVRLLNNTLFTLKMHRNSTMATVNTEDNMVYLLRSSIFVCFPRANDHNMKRDIAINNIIE